VITYVSHNMKNSSIASNETNFIAITPHLPTFFRKGIGSGSKRSASIPMSVSVSVSTIISAVRGSKDSPKVGLGLLPLLHISPPFFERGLRSLVGTIRSLFTLNSLSSYREREREIEREYEMERYKK
jgi:hypothetical protein